MRVANALPTDVERANRCPRAGEERMTRSTQWAGFRSVLCPIDFSENSRLALRYAAAIAARGRTILTVAYVNDPLLVAAAAAALHDRQLATRSATELRAFVDATLSRSARTSRRLKLHVATGRPADEIMDAAAQRGSDLVVLGTHGLTGADRLLMGSTTLSILQRTTVPVLAVPRSAQRPTAAALKSWPGKQVVAALELDTASGADVATAAQIARWFGASLLLLHVIGEIAAPAWLTRGLTAHDRIRVAQAQQRLKRLAARTQSLVKTDVRVICGRVADELAAFAVVERTGLVISALRDRRGWFGARRGSISYHVLSHTTTPVLAYPPQWRPR